MWCYSITIPDTGFLGPMKDVSDLNCLPSGTAEKEMDKEPECLGASNGSDVHLMCDH